MICGFGGEEYFIRQIAVTVMDEQGRVEVMNPHIQNMEVSFQLAENTKIQKHVREKIPVVILLSCSPFEEAIVFSG